MAISMETVLKCLTMVIGTKGCTPMGSQKGLGPMLGPMDRFIKESSKMDYVLGMEFGSTGQRSTKGPMSMIKGMDRGCILGMVGVITKATLWRI